MTDFMDITLDDARKIATHGYRAWATDDPDCVLSLGAELMSHTRAEKLLLGALEAAEAELNDERARWM